MVRRCELHLEQLRVAETMRSFIAHHLDDSKFLSLRLEQSETDLASIWMVAAEKTETFKTAEEEREALRIELERIKEREKTSKAKLKEAEQENTRLKKEMEKSPDWVFFREKEEIGITSSPRRPKGGVRGRVSYSEKGTGRGVLEAGRRDVLFLLLLLYEEK